MFALTLSELLGGLAIAEHFVFAFGSVLCDCCTEGSSGIMSQRGYVQEGTQERSVRGGCSSKKWQHRTLRAQWAERKPPRSSQYRAFVAPRAPNAGNLRSAPTKSIVISGTEQERGDIKGGNTYLMWLGRCALCTCVSRRCRALLRLILELQFLHHFLHHHQRNIARESRSKRHPRPLSLSSKQSRLHPPIDFGENLRAPLR